MPQPKRPTRTAFEQADSMTLTELDQVRVLSNPLRVRIMELLAREERTTKQVAEALGEKPTRLYHHVEALEKVGLIHQTRTRRNRGTLERYYLAVARRFSADPSLFAGKPSPPKIDTLRSLVSTVIDTTSRELDALVSHSSYGEELTEEGILSFVQIEADEKTIARVRRRLHRLLSDLQKIDDAADEGEPARSYRLTIAYYPLDRGAGDC